MWLRGALEYINITVAHTDTAQFVTSGKEGECEVNDWKICHTVICKVATLTTEVAVTSSSSSVSISSRISSQAVDHTSL